MSGNVVSVPNGAEIRYRASYSAEVETGKLISTPIAGTQKVWVRTHRDKRGRTIQGHWATYTDKQLIKFRPKLPNKEYGEPIWRVISEHKARPGQHFLGRAFSEDFPKIKDDLEFFLKKLEGNY